MNRFTMKRVVLCVACWYFFYSVIGCGSSNNATKYLDKYDALPYQDVTMVKAPADVAYRGALISFVQRGYVVTLSDPQSGLINAEINSASIIPEEQKADQAAKAKETTFGSVLLWIVGIILIFGIVLMILGSSDSKPADDNSSTSSSIQVGSSGPATATSYRYIITLTTAAVTDSTTELQISTVRMVVENGSVMRSERFENRYLNYSVFDAVSDQLNARRY